MCLASAKGGFQTNHRVVGRALPRKAPEYFGKEVFQTLGGEGVLKKDLGILVHILRLPEDHVHQARGEDVLLQFAFQHFRSRFTCFKNTLHRRLSLPANVVPRRS